MNTLTLFTHDKPIFDLSNVDKHTKSRLKKFNSWITQTGRNFSDPDLANYRDHLLENYSTGTVGAHLSTIRSAYNRLLTSNDFRTELYDQFGQEVSASDRKAFVDETMARLGNAINPNNSRVKLEKKQDQTDAEHLRLTQAEAEALMTSPDLNTLQGLRDSAIIAIMLCTGAREQEVCNLQVSDLRQKLDGKLALHIRHGKGNKTRLVPYGQLSWVLALVDTWLSGAGITDGFVFRGFYKGGQKLRSGKLTARSIEYILAKYPIMVDGKMRSVRPHDCRRTYARRMYNSGVDILAIQQNLGHASYETTKQYIGVLTADQRQPPAIYKFDLGRLKK